MILGWDWRIASYVDQWTQTSVLLFRCSEAQAQVKRIVVVIVLLLGTKLYFLKIKFEAWPRNGTGDHQFHKRLLTIEPRRLLL